MTKFSYTTLCFVIALGAQVAHADIDRVYHPYVELHERELEYGATLRDIDGNSVWLQRMGLGYAWSDRIFTEVYLVSESITHEGEKIHGYEAELKWQVTEQGEYWADWGMLFEVGKAKDINRYEFAAGIIWEKELANRWVATANFIAEYEFGRDIENELESAVRAQLRYRHSLAIEPAIEIYLDDQDWAAGPALTGIYKLSPGRQIKWELGLVFGLDSQTPSNSLRANLEFEF